jgi:Fur family ferric uptake transcriptional regulator
MTDLERLCRDRGVKLTGQRRLVLDVLDAATDHPCTHEIHRRVLGRDRRIGVATVYRTLNRLVAAGIVARHVFRDGKARYERCGRAPHPHLIDLATGEIVEVDDEGLAARLEEEAHRLGYRLVEYRLKLSGQRKD